MRRILFVLIALVAQFSFAAGEFLAESECNRAQWVASFGYASYAAAEKAIPLLVAKAALLEGKKAGEHIPAAVLKDPAKAGPAHYKDWAGSIFISPWNMKRAGGKYDSKRFLFVSSDGNIVEGETPNDFPETDDGKVENFVKFTHPVSKKETYLTLKHERTSGVTPEGATTVSEEEHAVTGLMDPFKEKYVELKVAAGVPKDARFAVHMEIEGDIRSLRNNLEDKSTPLKAAKFVLDACQKIKAPSAPLKEQLDLLSKEVAALDLKAVAPIKPGKKNLTDDHEEDKR